MLQIRIAIDLACLGQPLRAALETAARLGFRAIQLDAHGELQPGSLSASGVRHFRKLLEDYNLQLATLRFRTRRGYNVLDRLEARVDATCQAMDLAYQLGCNLLVNHVGRVPQEQQGPEWDILVDVLSRLGQHGQRVGAQLAASTGSEDPSCLAQLLEALPEGSLAVDLDPAQLIINGFSPSDAVRQLAADIRHVHANDAVHDLARGRGVETVLGEGTVDFAEIFGILEEHRYDGYFTMGRENAAQPVMEIQQGMTHMRSFE